MSTGLNSMAGVIYEDLVKPNLARPLSEEKASRLMKGLVLIIGTICTILVFVVEKLGTLIQVSSFVFDSILYCEHYLFECFLEKPL